MGEPIWQPSEDRIKGTNMFKFLNYINKRYDKSFVEYEDLYQWSINNITCFWRSLWDFLDIIHSKTYDDVLIDGHKMPGARWFVGSKLNFAENLLRYRDDHIALIFKGEADEPIRITYKELYDRVARLAKSMREMGIVTGDRVVGFMPNMPETIIAMLAAASIGALWSSCSPDFGIRGVLDRFGQIEPKLIFTANGYHYNGKKFDSIDKIASIIKDLPSIERVVVVPYTDSESDISSIPSAVHYRDFISKENGLDVTFEQLPFEHPLYIMYSSGTTGLPKCMVQGGGGILIHHMKELMLHTDLKREDRIFYFTTCGWMMWNWLVSSLSIGALIILFDGSPFYPNPGVLFQLAQDEKMTIFGTSAKYISALSKESIQPCSEYDLSALKALLSTGSPLTSDGFEYVYNHIKSDICLSSISGGTDLNGCFAAGNPMGPVYSGELQCRTLAMKVEAFNDMGKPVTQEKGELVCTAPFPSMPTYFWNDQNGEKYHKAYFDVYPNVWRHGDFIEITEHNGVIIYGRSDATLNPGGVRIGTAEIYRQVENFDEVTDSLVIGQNWKDDLRVILFVMLEEGIGLTDELKNKIKKTIRQNTTPRHVPAKIIKIDDIPYTINLKKVEMAVRNVIHGEEVLNRDALKNPEALELYKDLKELQED
ncbi:MAG: acetoacetate--CoA ligase [Spirochaetota bacterium]|nr:acetoacetate--CoA ligase [Spirochaetota bacterium]